MKTKHLLLSVLFLFTVTLNYSQASFTEAGIAVQGIVRDANNTAIQNQTVTLEFQFYYFDETTTAQNIGSAKSKQVVTDNFGVFSTIIDPSFTNNQAFSNYKVWLRIKKQGDVDNISDAPLNHVPYAISANNGVPTGSIMPYMGTTAPAGWLLCNGSSVPAGSALQAFLINEGLDSNNTPDLQGMFLRGAGTNANTPVTTVLGQTQDDVFKEHNHEKGSISTVEDGLHQHTNTESMRGFSNGSQAYATIGSYNPSISTQVDVTSGEAGLHTHSITGNTANTGDVAETRPVNYGVNYIIKL